MTIIYTPWANLLKTAGMATGQVSFHDNKKVWHLSLSLPSPSLHTVFKTLQPQTKKILVPTRTNAIINRLEKTRTIGSASDLPAAKETYLSQQRAKKRAESERKKKEEERVMRERREEKEGRERGWEALRKGEGEGRSNEEGWDEDDFM